jgi:hypothetical protein
MINLTILAAQFTGASELILLVLLPLTLLLQTIYLRSIFKVDKTIELLSKIAGEDMEEVERKSRESKQKIGIVIGVLIFLTIIFLAISMAS